MKIWGVTLENPQLHENVVSKLQHILHHHNPFVHVLRQLALQTDLHQCSEIVNRDVETLINERDIKVTTHVGNIISIQETVGYYDSMQYFYSHMERAGGIQTQQAIMVDALHVESITIRPNDRSLLLRSGRLLQQYVVDNYVQVEAGRLRWIRQNQNNIRVEVHQVYKMLCIDNSVYLHLHNHFIVTVNVGQRTILLSSFIGSRRDLTLRYEDGMAIVLNDGKPNIFLTMTCNPSWSEITSELQEFQTAQDRPDLTTIRF
ncbi:hypothetical protein Lal_00039663 [Lupinus albus]|nr:hypothetical protein Lal_00039663 [Lupinus albus]